MQRTTWMAAALIAGFAMSPAMAQTEPATPSSPPALPFAPPPRKPLPVAHPVPTAAEAERIAASDKVRGATGDHERAYWFAAGGALMPYRLYVPDQWAKGRRGMIVMLHGGGADQDAIFARAGTELKALADQHGYILLVPLGYSPLGGFGARFTPPPAPNGAQLPPFAGSERESSLSEADTLSVVDRTAAEYHVDPSRIYLMGNSMGGAGTWYLGESHPRRWAAISPSDGPPRPADYPFARLKGIHVLAVHGEKDVLAPIAVTREMVAGARAAGADVTFLPIPDGEHSTAWQKMLPQVFAFFDEHPGR